MPPDEVRSSTSGPPPRTLPATARRSIAPTMVTGWRESIRPELVCASRSKAAVSGTWRVMLPEAVETCHSPEGVPCTETLPLALLTRSGDWMPRRFTLPEAAEIVTSPGGHRDRAAHVPDANRTATGVGVQIASDRSGLDAARPSRRVHTATG